MTKKKIEKAGEAKVLTGNHLTVTTYPDGRVNLKWDWDALTKDVVAATFGKGRDLVAETEIKVRKTRKKKTD